MPCAHPRVRRVDEELITTTATTTTTTITTTTTTTTATTTTTTTATTTNCALAEKSKHRRWVFVGATQTHPTPTHQI